LFSLCYTHFAPPASFATLPPRPPGGSPQRRVSAGGQHTNAGAMANRYEVVRSVNDKSLHVIFRAGTFEMLPDRVRHLGPWQGMEGGEIELLKAQYRVQLASQGFALVYEYVGSFRATN
jgi:hypothetical protein